MLFERMNDTLRFLGDVIARELADAWGDDPPPRRAIDCMELEDRTLFSATPLGAETLVNTNTVGAQQTQPATPQAVASDSSGNYVVAWTSFGQGGDGATESNIYAQQFNAAGSAVGAEFLVNSTTTGSQGGASVAMDANGNFIITWTSDGGQDGSGEGIFAQRYNAAGVAQGGEFQVNSYTAGDQEDANVAMDATGNFVVTWSSNGQDGSGYGVYAQRFNASGVAQGSEFQVNTATAEDQRYSTIAMNANGDFVIDWSTITSGGTDAGVRAQRYNAAGAAQGGEIAVNTYTTNFQENSTVAMDAAGNFVVTWSSMGQDGDSWGIYAQRFSASGSRLGSEFHVSTTTTAEQQYSSVEMDSVGNFVVTWSGNKQDDGASWGIYGQQYDNTGAAIGSEFLINSTTSGDQQFSSVAPAAHGFVVVWSGNGLSDADGVYMQRYDDGINRAPVNTLPPDQTINEDTSLVLTGGTRISISDSDAGSSAVQVTLSATDGLLTLGSTKGLTFSTGTGSNNATMVFTGTLNNINSDLKKLTFAPTANYNGAATISVTTDDLGNTGTGGAQSTTSVLNVTINAVNDAPVNTVPAAQTTKEDTILTFSSAGGNAISVVDVDANGGTEQITLTAAQGTLTLSGTTGLTFSTGTGTRDGSMVFSGNMADINTALDGMKFTPGVNYNGAASVQIVTNDQGNTGSGGALTASSTVNITVQAVNDAPTRIFNPSNFNGNGSYAYNDSSGNFFVQGAQVNTANIQSDIQGGAIHLSDSYATIASSAGVVLYFDGSLTLGSLQSLKVASSGSPLAVNIWIDSGHDGSFFSFSGTQLTSLNGDSYATHLMSAGEQIGANTPFSMAAGNGAGGTYTLAQLQQGAVAGIDSQTAVAVWIGNNGTFSSDISSITLSASPVIKQLTVLEDSGTTSLGLAGLAYGPGGGADEAGQTLTYGVTGVPSAALGQIVLADGTTVVTSSTNYSLAQIQGMQFKAVANANGSGVFSFNAQDSGGTANGGVNTLSQQVAINVTSVNDAPVRTSGSVNNLTVQEDSGLTSLGLGGLSYSPGGGADEAGQSLSYTITSVPGAGLGQIVLADGTTVVSSGASYTLTQLQGMQFKTIQDANGGPATFSYTVQDSGGTANGGVDTISESLTISVTAVNDPPVNTMPGTQGTSINSPLTFSSAQGNAISISDVDAAGNPEQVALSTSNGTLTLSGTAGLTFSSGSGTGDASMTFTGTLANINAALDGLQYTPPTGYVGQSPIQLTTNDLGNTGAGGAQTTSSNVNVTVNNGLWLVTTGNVSSPSGAPGLGAWQNSQILDFGNPNLALGSGTTAGTLASVFDLSNFTGQNAKIDGIHYVSRAVSVGSAHRITLLPGDVLISTSADVDLASINKLKVKSEDIFAFRPSSPGDYNSGSFFQIIDGSSAVPNAIHDFALVEQDTIVGGTKLAAGTFLLAQSGSPQQSNIYYYTATDIGQGTTTGSASVLVDGSDLGINGAVLGVELIQTTRKVGGDSLVAGQILVSFAANETVGVNNLAVSRWDVAALSLTGTGNSTAGTASMVFRGEDVGFSTAAESVGPIALADVLGNQPPVNSLPAAQTASEDVPLVFSSAGGNAISISDPDAGAGTVQVTLTVTNGSFSLSGTSGLSFSTGSGTADAKMVFTGDLNDINAALEGASYTGSLNYNGAATLQIVTNDLGNSGSGGAKSASDTLAITVTAVNDPPVNAVPPAQTINEDTPLVFSAVGGNAISISDVDSAGNPEQVTLTATNGVLTLSGTTGLTFSSGTGSASAGMTFTGTIANINAALNGLRFDPNSNFNGAANLQIQTNDLGNTGAGGAQTATDNVAITVNAVNDAPVNSLPPAQTTNENTPIVFSTAGGNAVSISDVDAGASPVQVTVSVASGSLTLSGAAGLSFTSGTGTGDSSMTFTGLITDINAALNGLTYRPTTSYNGPDALQITTNDLGNTGAGGPLTASGSVAISIAAVNDPPVNTMPGYPATHGGALNFDGTNSFVQVSDAPSLQMSNTTTIEAWVNARATSSTNQVILNKEGEYEVGILPDGTLGWAFANTTPGWNWTSTGYVVPLGQWTHVAVSYNAGAVSAYVNGNLVQTVNGSGTIGDAHPQFNDLTIGGRENATDQRFNGFIDDVRVWNTARTQAQVQAAMNQTLTGAEAGLAGNWQFEDAAGTVALDASPNGNNGSLGNGSAANRPTWVDYRVNEDTPFVFSSSTGNNVRVSDVDANGLPERVTLSVASGTLTLSQTTGLTISAGANGSATMTFSGTLANINAALDGLSYTGNLNFNGLDTLTISTNDLGNTGSGGPKTTTDTLPITVLPVNDAPVNSVPAAQFVNEDTAVAFSTAGGNRIFISDVDANGGPEQVTLSVNSGTLTLNGTSGLTIDAGANGNSTITFTGTLSNINAALDGLSYTGSLNFNGVDTLGILSNDLGNSGSGGAKTSFNTLQINVQPVNDPPVNSVPAAQVTNEDTPFVFSASTGNPISIGDVDGNGAPEQVTLSVASGTLALSQTTGLTISAGANGSSTMTFTGTLANINAALDGLSYTGNLNFNGVDTLTLTTNDLGNTGSGGAKTASDTVSITVQPVNDAPVNNVPAAQTVNEDTPLIFSSSAGNQISIGDVDANGNPEQVSLSVTNGTLTLSRLTGLTFTSGTGAGNSSMVFTGTVANINAALNGMSFGPDANYNGPATLQIVTNDQGNTGSGGPLSATSTVNIDVQAVNNAPTRVFDAGNFTGNGSYAYNDSSGNFFVQNTQVNTGSIQSDLQAGAIHLSDSYAASASSAGIVLYFDGSLTLGNLQALQVASSGSPLAVNIWIDSGHDGKFFSFTGNQLSSLNGDSYATHLMSAGEPIGANTSFSMVAGNGAGGTYTLAQLQQGAVAGIDSQTAVAVWVGNNGTFSSDISSIAVSAAPTVKQLTVLEDSGATSLGLAGLAYGPGGGADEAGQTLTFNVTGVPSAALGQIVLADGTTVVNSGASYSLVQLQGMQFKTAANSNGGPAAFSFAVQDSGGTANGGVDTLNQQVIINVTPVNDAPVRTGGSVNNLTVLEDSGLTSLGLGSVSYSPGGGADEASQTLTYTVTSVPSAGLGQIVLADGTTVVSSGASYTLTQLRGMQFKTVQDANGGPATFSFAVRDSGGTANGGVDAINESLTIGVTAVNDAPVNRMPGAQMTNEDTPLVFSSAGGNAIVVSDVDAGNSPVQVTLSTADGTLTLNGVSGLIFSAGTGAGDAAMTITGTIANINAALDGLTFRPTSNQNGAAALQIVTNDLGNSGQGGALSASNTLPITIVAVNDAPVAIVPGNQRALSQGIIFSAAKGNAIRIGDVDAGNSPVQVRLVADQGFLTLSRTTGLAFSIGTGTADATMVITGTIANINAALDGAGFIPLSRTSGITITVNDQGNTGLGGPLQASGRVTILQVPMLPPGSSTSSSADADSDATVRPVPPPPKPPSLPTPAPAAGDGSGTVAPRRAHAQAGNAPVVKADLAGNEREGSLGTEIFEVMLTPPSNAARTATLAGMRRGTLASGDLLWNQLDLLGNQLDSQTVHQAFAVGAVAGFTVLMSAGYMVWCLRGGVLLASAISSLPMWRSFDPLPVLEFWERNEKQHDDEQHETDEELAEETNLETLLT